MGAACCRLVKHKQREEEMQEERYIQRENTTSARRFLRSCNRQYDYCACEVQLDLLSSKCQSAADVTIHMNFLEEEDPVVKPVYPPAPPPPVAPV